MIVELLNWWCPECRDWVASDDMNEANRHRECKTKCEWVRFTPCVFSCVLKGADDDGRANTDATGRSRHDFTLRSSPMPGA